MNYMSPVRLSRAYPPEAEDLDDYVCWSRMQAEAGQGLDAIVARKETERRTGDGLFLWGVGNAPAVAITALARMGLKVPAVFSVMKSRPKAVDVAPARTFAWRRYQDELGTERPLPDHVIVTSRGDAAGGPKRAHYALMCFSPRPLSLERGTPFPVSSYRNAGGNGAPVGASQVTALLRRMEPADTGGDYEINMRAWLTGGYWVRLADPVEVAVEASRALDHSGDCSPRAWRSLARELRSGSPPASVPTRREELLLL